MFRTLGFVKKLLPVILLLFCISCSNSKPKELEFYYYPDLNLYYDVAKKNYLFSLDGGNTWDTVDAKTKTIPEALGQKVVLHSATDSIWKDNKMHLQQYKGYVYNIADDDTAGEPQNTIVTEKKKPVEKVITDNEETDKKPKKGLGKLLQKIFGKKKDKKE